MIQRLFLNRIHTKAAGSPVGGQDDLILPPFAHEAEALLPLLELAIPRTKVALDTTVIQPVPVLGRRYVRRTHYGVSDEVSIACTRSIDIVPSGDASQVFGIGGEQPPSRAVAPRRQVTITR
jgi:hypothetical protein